MPSPDLSEFEGLSKPYRLPCVVGAELDGEVLSPDEKAQLQAALDKDKSVITHSAITEWAERRGIESFNSQRVSVHRRGVCTCGRA